MKWNIFGKQMEIKTEFAVIFIATLILLGCLAGYLFSRGNNGILIEAESVPGLKSTGNSMEASNSGKTGMTGTTGMEKGVGMGEATGSTAGSIGTASGNTAETGMGSTTASTEEIEVYVVGCVNRPGIVMLKKGDVIYDAVEKAGGLSRDADASGINMVYKLNGNTMLYIKSKKEVDSGTTALSSAKGKVLPVQKASPAQKATPGIGAELIEGSGSSTEVSAGESVDDTGSGVAGESGKGTVNINTADIAALDKLPGVGEATAQEIISYRDRNGPYQKIEDIMKVPRIKQGRFDSIKDLISVN